MLFGWTINSTSLLILAPAVADVLFYDSIMLQVAEWVHVAGIQGICKILSGEWGWGPGPSHTDAHVVRRFPTCRLADADHQRWQERHRFQVSDVER